MPFEELGLCVVRGPELILGADIKNFFPPSATFDGLIGGPPCQRFSRLANIVRQRYGEEALAENMIPQFERVATLVEPRWFVMENVPDAPLPVVPGYIVRDYILNNRWCPDEEGIGSVQNRVRRFCFGTPEGLELRFQLAAIEACDWEPAVCASVGGKRAVPVKLGKGGKPKREGHTRAKMLHTRSFAEECKLTGLPDNYLADSPFTARGKHQIVGNGVPLPMGRAVATAVLSAVYGDVGH